MAKGFEGRIFLTSAEHETYLRRMPVRYLRQPLQPVCAICGKGPTGDNPFERSHRVPFGLGVRRFKLTPDWLDSDHNIVTAHRKGCNKAAELSEEVVARFVDDLMK